MWTGGQNAYISMRFQTKTHQCGRGLIIVFVIFGEWQKADYSVRGFVSLTLVCLSLQPPLLLQSQVCYQLIQSTLSKRVNVTIKCYALHIIGVNDKEGSRTILDVARYFSSDFSMSCLFGRVYYNVNMIIIAIETRGSMSSP